MRALSLLAIIICCNALSQQTHRCSRGADTIPLAGPSVPFCTIDSFIFEAENLNFEIQRGSLINVDTGEVIVNNI